MYNWQLPDWPNFTYETCVLKPIARKIEDKALQLSGSLKVMPEQDILDAELNTLIEEATKTSEIEGELISRADIRSSIANKLGLNLPPKKVADKRATGITELLFHVRDKYKQQLTEEELFDWHTSLFSYLPTFLRKKMIIGNWRIDEEPMQVVSGPIGKWKVHFEAPPAKDLPNEMKQFFKWFNGSEEKASSSFLYGILRSGIAHLYFESIHPFDDGNGRIGRAISEKALAQTLRRPSISSISHVIEASKKEYYSQLEGAQRNNEITDWLLYFTDVILRAQQRTEEQIDFVLRKARLFDSHQGKLNQRQTKVINKMLENLPYREFEGGMNARTYIALTGTSKATATRDLQKLSELGILIPMGAGRGQRYQLKI